MASRNEIHNDFNDITIHTAKCDMCDKHNKQVIKQCKNCGMNFCTPCLLHRGGDGTHVMNSGDDGYASAVASRAKRESFLKPKSERVVKKDSKSPSPMSPRRKTRRTRRRRVIIEESEDEEVSNFEEHAEDQVHEESPPARSEREISELRRGKLPALRIEDPTSPSTEGPSNQATSAGSQFPEYDENADFDTSRMGFDTNDFDASKMDFDTNNLDIDTLAGADTLLAFAAGPPDSRRRTSDDAPQMSLRGGAVSTEVSPVDSIGTESFGRSSFGVDSFGTTNSNSKIITEQRTLQPSPTFVAHEDASNVHAFTALTPTDPTWLSTPAASSSALISDLFPYDYSYDFDLNNPLWSSTTAQPMRFPIDASSSNDEDIWTGIFYGEGDTNGDKAAANSSSDAAAAAATEKNKGWIIPDEDEEEGEIKEDGGRASTGKR